MVLPFLLGAAALTAGAVGIKGGVDATIKNSKAKKVQRKAEKNYERAERRLKKARDTTTATLENLGKLKLEVWSQQLGRFVELFEQLTAVCILVKYSSNN